MKNILPLIIALSLIGCDAPVTDNKSVSDPHEADTSKTDSAETVSVKPDSVKTVSIDTFYIDESEVTSDYKEFEGEKIETEVIVKNRADYSDNFIQGLQGLGYAKIELKDSLIILDDTDTSYFPKTLKIGREIVLTERSDVAVALIVERINYTTIDYKIEMVVTGKASHTQSGQADLNSGFFLGAESDESEKTGAGYFVTEYSEYAENDCYIHIRLGYDEDFGPFLLAKLKKNCSGKVKDITLDNFRALMEK